MFISAASPVGRERPARGDRRDELGLGHGTVAVADGVPRGGVGELGVDEHAPRSGA